MFRLSSDFDRGPVDGIYQRTDLVKSNSSPFLSIEVVDRNNGIIFLNQQLIMKGFLFGPLLSWSTVIYVSLFILPPSLTLFLGLERSRISKQI